MGDGMMLPPMQFLPSSMGFDRSKLRDPLWNARAALRLLKRDYEAVPKAWRPYAREETTMAGIELRAPGNPYRRLVDGEQALEPIQAWGFGSPGRAPRRHDDDEGPGLTAGDLDRMARQHFLDGFAKAQREADEKIEMMQGRLAEVFDEGYIEGRKFRATALARDYWPRLLGPMGGIHGVEAVLAKPRSTKADIAKAVEGLRRDWEEFRDWAEAMLNDPTGSVADDPHVEKV